MIIKKYQLKKSLRICIRKTSWMQYDEDKRKNILDLGKDLSKDLWRTVMISAEEGRSCDKLPRGKQPDP